MKRPLYIYFSPSLARLRKFRGIRGFCAALTKPRLLSPPGQLAGGCLQTGFFTCEPQHAPETNFKSGGRPGLPAGGGERPAPGVHPAWSVPQVLAPAQRCPPGAAGSACGGAAEPSRSRGRGWDGTAGKRRSRARCLGCGRARLSPGEPRWARAAVPAQPAPPPGSGSGQAAAALGWTPLAAGARRL